jgi:hypothetical protein
MNVQRLVRAHHGWLGQFTTQQAKGAIPNDTRIRKRIAKPGEQAKVGSTGRVLGSLSNDRLGIGYFVEWDHFPSCAVFIMGNQIGPIPVTAEVDAKAHVWPGGTPLRP